MTYSRDRLRQSDDSPNEYPVSVKFESNQPRVNVIYYLSNSNIDERNCNKKYDLQLERKLQTKYWSIIVNTSILVMNNIDTTILVRILCGGVKGTLQSSTTIFHRR